MLPSSRHVPCWRSKVKFDPSKTAVVFIDLQVDEDHEVRSLHIAALLFPYRSRLEL